MDFFLSQEAEFFDTTEKILEDEKAGQGEGSIDSPHSDSMSPFRPAFSEGELGPLDPAKQLSTIRLLPTSTKKLYVTVKALMEDVNKITSC